MAQAEAQVKSLATTLGYAGALDTDSLWSMVEYRQRRSVEDILEMGRGLLLIKEQTAHGEFQEQIATRGFNYRTAARLMTVALKFSKSDTVSLLKAAGTQAKVLELAVLDDEDLQALESGESVAGITVDDVERMSASQLRAALREARADADAKDQRINKLSDDLNKESEKTLKAQRRWKAATPDEQLVALKQSVTEAEQNVLAAIGSEGSGLRASFQALADFACDNHVEEDAARFLSDVIGRLLTSVRIARDDEDLAIAIPVTNDAGI
ncbi:TPA: DUF3102 domain-containing protein [Stenotrophomonas maltophilia]|uniref:DUF3102 domain-containing protein n=1 Tax=Stenotrophomonas maltophilia TaxID=40324 RepID=UPI0016525C8C|nr:DUF3102 domain-containing protein [Stenotrophomonas maltophilia]MBH1614823.1 DUF3102 domain-containing protein [Stenotrophomonas maltophilia]MCU1041875.1 DUF3102 domain-containing protein [Stenotrophomonas maltophilia]